MKSNSSASQYFIYIWIFFFMVTLGTTLNYARPYKGDESFYTVSALNMAKTNNYVIPFYFGHKRIFEKPILTYWLTLLGYKICGFHFFGARIFFLLISGITLLIVYRWAQLINNEEDYARLCVLMLSAGTLYLTFSRFAMTDLLLTFFITASLFFFTLALNQPFIKRRYFIAVFVCFGAGIATKGGAALLPLAAMVLYVWFSKPVASKKILMHLVSPTHWLIAIGLGVAWYIIVLYQDPNAFFNQLDFYSSYTETGNFFILKLKKLYYYLGVLIRYYFPFSIIALFLYFKNKPKLDKGIVLPLIFVIWILLLFILFIKMNKSRYLLPCIPAFTLVIGNIIYATNQVKVIQKLAVFFFLIQAIGLHAIPMIQGEPIKKLIHEWSIKKDGSISLESTEKKIQGWAYVFSAGELILDGGDTTYKIVKQNDLAQFPDYKKIKQASRINKIKFKKGHLVLLKEHFYLIKRQM